MKIWLLTIGEPVPMGAGLRDRPHRTGAFARYLVSRGHKVVWWTSAFDHFRKQHLAEEDTFLTEPDGLRIRLLRGSGYKRNVSFQRFRDHAQVARRFQVLSEFEEMPDILVSALPTVEMCLAAGVYGRRNSVPTVVDLRDMWPDILTDVAPPVLRPLARLALTPLFHQARRACAQATALTGITEAFVDWGLARGRRKAASSTAPFLSPTTQRGLQMRNCAPRRPSGMDTGFKPGLRIKASIEMAQMNSSSATSAISVCNSTWLMRSKRLGYLKNGMCASNSSCAVKGNASKNTAAPREG